MTRESVFLVLRCFGILPRHRLSLRQIVVGHKLPMPAGFPRIIADGAELIVHGEVAVVIQMGEVGRAVVLKVTALVVNAFDKQVVHVRHAVEQV